MEESKQINQVIDVLMLAGTLLIESGSEIHRVEDTMIRIAHSQGIVDCNVLAMPVAIFFSIENANVTRMKRILRTNYNIERSVMSIRSLVNSSLERSISSKPTRP